MGQSRSAQTKKSSRQGLPSDLSSPIRSVHKIDVDGGHVFYRAAGDPDAPVVLLLNGFPVSSFMFRELIPRLAYSFGVIGPDLPALGFTEVPGAPFSPKNRQSGNAVEGVRPEPTCPTLFALE